MDINISIFHIYIHAFDLLIEVKIIFVFNRYIQYDGGERYSEKNIGFPKSLCKIASLNDM